MYAPGRCHGDIKTTYIRPQLLVILVLTSVVQNASVLQGIELLSGLAHGCSRDYHLVLDADLDDVAPSDDLRDIGRVGADEQVLAGL